MSSQDLTTTGLMNTIRILASVPNNQQLSSDDATLLNLLNFEMSNSLVPQMLAVKQEYFVKNYDFNNTLDATTGIWNDTYELPPEAIGMELRDFVQLTTPAAANTPPTERFIPRISPEDVAGQALNTTSTGNGGISFYMKGNDLVLYPCPVTTLAFRMKFFRMPNYLVSTADCGQILSINTITNSVVLSNIPSTWSVGTSVDVIQSYQGFDLDAENIVITSLSSPTVGFASVKGLQVGDWVALNGDSPIPQLPIACQAVLAQAVVVKLLESLKDEAGVRIAQQKYNELFKAMEFMIVDRVQGEPLKITSGGRGLADYMRASKGWGGYRS